eukprot:SAG25_NODE_1196_length_3645_cov_2.730476_5_plen_238_part_00
MKLCWLSFASPALALYHPPWQWHIGDSKAYNDSTGYHAAAPSPKHYGIDVSKCYVCNPDTPDAEFDTGDPWFPANSSRLLVDAGAMAIEQATSQAKPFYINLWFHISHAPMFPTPEQYEALAHWEAPATGNCATNLKAECVFPFEGGFEQCLACTREHSGSCSPKQRQTYCDTNGTGLTSQAATLCGENKDGDYATCGKLVYRASQFEADKQIGRLLDTLDGKQLSNSTMVIFSGDK